MVAHIFLTQWVLAVTSGFTVASEWRRTRLAAWEVVEITSLAILHSSAFKLRTFEHRIYHSR